MKHNYKRFLAMVMAVVMIVGMMPMNVFAADGDTKTGGKIHSVGQ